MLPLGPGPVSNGEFVPPAPSRRDHDLARLMIERSDASARRAGIPRRAFLHSAGGVAAALAVYNLAACSSAGRSGAASRAASGSAPTTTAGGSFSVPTSDDVEACAEALSGNEFIFDVHTHHVMPDRPWVQNAPSTVGLVEGMLPPGCVAGDPLECVNRAAYLHSVFLASDTTVALLSDVPNSGPDDAPIPFPDAVDTQQLAESLTHGGAQRLLLHNVIAPNVGDLAARLDGMTATADTGHVAGFKVYTAWGPDGRGYALDDPAIGLPVVQHAHDLGVRVLTAHKGLPLVNFDVAHNGPDDIVAVSRLFPDMQFVVFHGAWDSRLAEGPYNPAATQGIDSLLAALDRHQVPPNDNVWADLGSVWRQLLTSPGQAAHALGKLLGRLGADRVLWGTDAVWYGSPQPQIMAFRAFEISEQLQEQYGYPALSAATKAKVLGLNAASLFGIDPEATRCALESDPLSTASATATAMGDEGALGSGWEPRGPTTRREVLRWLASPATRWTPA